MATFTNLTARLRPARRDSDRLAPLAAFASPRMLAGLFLLLAVASDLKLRRRSARAALSGEVDWQVMLELGVWGLVALWLVARALLARFPARQLLPDVQGPVLRTYQVIGVMVVISSVIAGSLISIVRAGQLLVLVVVAGVCVHHVRRHPKLLAEFWMWGRRGLVALTTLCVMLSFVPGMQFRGGRNVGRYHWFAMHPIATGVIIGLAILALVAAYLALPDPLIRRAPAAWAGLSALLLLMLFMTKSRGPIFATVMGLITLAVLSPHRARRNRVLLGLLGMLPFLILGVGMEELTEAILRGQTPEQLYSLTGRTHLFAHAWELALEQPIFGYGFLAGRFIFLEAFHWAGESHNALIEVLVSLGFVGVVLYVVMFALLIRALVRLVRHGDGIPRLMGIEASALVVFSLGVGVIADGFAGAPGFSLYALLLAAVAADASIDVATVGLSRS